MQVLKSQNARNTVAINTDIGCRATQLLTHIFVEYHECLQNGHYLASEALKVSFRQAIDEHFATSYLRLLPTMSPELQRSIIAEFNSRKELFIAYAWLWMCECRDDWSEWVQGEFEAFQRKIDLACAS